MGFLPPVIAELRATTTEFSAKISESAAKLDELARQRAEVVLKATVADFDAKIAEAKAELEDLDKESDRAIELRANIDDYSAKMEEANAELEATDATAEESGSRLGEVGKSIALGLGGALLGVGAMAIDLGEKFQTATASLAGHAGISVAAANKIGSAFLATAGKTTFSAAEMMGAIGPIGGEIENLSGHTLTAKDSMMVLKGSMDLAEASAEPLASVTKSLVDIMLPFHMNLSQSSNAANILWNSQRALGVTTGDLTKTYERLVPRVAGSGMSLQQMSGFVVELSHSLGGGRQALRTAGTAIQGLISPSSTANKALAAMGIQLFNANGKFIGMGPAIERMRSGLATLPGAAGGVAAAQKIVALTTEQATLKGEAQTKSVKAQEAAISGQLPVLKLQAGAFTQSSAMQAIFGRQANGMLAVIAGGAATFNKYTDAVGKSGQVQSAAAINAATMHGALKKLEATGEDLVTTLGTKLVPAVTLLMNGAASAAQYIGPVLGGAFNVVKSAIEGTVAVISGIINWFRQASVPAIALGVVLTAVLGPAFISLAASAAVSLATMVADAVTSAAGTTAAFVSMYVEAAAQYVLLSAKAAASFVATTAKAVAGAAEQTAAWVASGATTIASAVVTAATWLAQTAVMVAASVAGAVASAAAWVVANLAMTAGIALVVIAVAAAVFLIIKYHEDIEKAAIAVWHAIEDAAEAVWSAIKGFVSDAVNFIKDHWELILAILLGPIALAVLGIKTYWNTIKSDASKLISDITGFFTGLPGKIMSALSGLAGMFLSLGEDAVKSFESAFSHLASDVGSLVKSAVSSIPGVGGVLSHIPGLATGGLVSKPTLAVVGEAGPELVIPIAQMKAQFASGISPLPMPVKTATSSNGTATNSTGGSVTYAPVYELQVQGDASPQTVLLLRSMLESHDEQLMAALRAMR